MGLIANIKLANRISKSIKKAKTVLDEKQGIAKDVQKAIKNIKADFEVLIGLLPDLKEAYLDILELFKNVK